MRNSDITGREGLIKLMRRWISYFTKKIEGENTDEDIVCL